MIDWIMTCVSTASYSVSINGNIHGFFQGQCGLKQGYPISPYIFTLIIEVINLMLKRRIAESRAFIYHRQCKEQKITHCALRMISLFSSMVTVHQFVSFMILLLSLMNPLGSNLMRIKLKLFIVEWVREPKMLLTTNISYDSLKDLFW